MLAEESTVFPDRILIRGCHRCGAPDHGMDECVAIQIRAGIPLGYDPKESSKSIDFNKQFSQTHK